MGGQTQASYCSDFRLVDARHVSEGISPGLLTVADGTPGRWISPVDNSLLQHGKRG